MCLVLILGAQHINRLLKRLVSLGLYRRLDWIKVIKFWSHIMLAVLAVAVPVFCFVIAIGKSSVLVSAVHLGRVTHEKTLILFVFRNRAVTKASRISRGACKLTRTHRVNKIFQHKGQGMEGVNSDYFWCCRRSG